MNILQNKKILLCVTGSIAIYKSLELVRLYTKTGATVKVLMSNGAIKFITPLTFEALSKNKVLTSDNESWANELNHIDIGKWADIIVIAPITANTINKLANGIADNLLTQTLLAYKGIKLIAPAANTNMLENNFTQSSIKLLKLSNYEVVEPIVKELACKDVGKGAMANIQDIFYKTCRILLKKDFWKYRRVVVSGGATIEKIDSVRFLSNFSSGKMANALVKALYMFGSEVCYVRGNVKDYDIPSEVHVIDAQSVEEMDEYINDCIRVSLKGIVTKQTLVDETTPKLIQKKPFYFGVAAVSDYKVKYPQNTKLKKEDLGDEFDLKLLKTKDILANITNKVYKIGFKAEYDENVAKQHALNALHSKQLDAICLNLVSKYNFGDERNEIELIMKNKHKKIAGAKLEVAFELLGEIEKNLAHL